LNAGIRWTGAALHNNAIDEVFIHILSLGGGAVEASGLASSVTGNALIQTENEVVATDAGSGFNALPLRVAFSLFRSTVLARTETAISIAAIGTTLLTSTIGIANISASAFRAAVEPRGAGATTATATILAADLVLTLGLADLVTRAKGGTDRILEALTTATTTPVGATILAIAQRLTDTESLSTGHLERAVATTAAAAIAAALLTVTLRLAMEDADKLVGTLMVGGAERATTTAAVIPAILPATVRFTRGRQIRHLVVDVKLGDIIDDICRRRNTGQVQTAGGAIFDDHPHSAVLFRNVTSQQRFKGTVLILSALLLTRKLTYL
jgi:hypothetical protein